MTDGDQGEIPWALPDEYLDLIFQKMKKRVEGNSEKLFFDWSRPILSEVTPNVERSLKKNFTACSKGYSAAKIAGLYTFWIAKLKPAFSIIEDKLVFNEYLAVGVGIHIVQERTGIQIRLSHDELLDICDTLRYHTSSPHLLMHLYEMWIDREKLKTAK